MPSPSPRRASPRSACGWISAAPVSYTHLDVYKRQPSVLPAKYPNLLVNGAGGIAVGMATNIPPHNLGEVCNAALLLLEQPEASDQEILEIIPGPDFPTGAQIVGRAGARKGLLEAVSYTHLILVNALSCIIIKRIYRHFAITERLMLLKMLNREFVYGGFGK